MKKFLIVLTVLAMAIPAMAAEDIDSVIERGLKALQTKEMATVESVEGEAVPAGMIIPIGAVIRTSTYGFLIVRSYERQPILKAKVNGIGTFHSFSYYGGGTYYAILNYKQTKKFLKKLYRGKQYTKGKVWSKYETKTYGWYTLIK